MGPTHVEAGTGGWRRVVYLNMTDPTSSCPSGWQLIGYSKRTCERASSQANVCDSATFPIDGTYVEGVSLTHGSPRQHIWTNAAGL